LKLYRCVGGCTTGRSAPAVGRGKMAAAFFSRATLEGEGRSGEERLGLCLQGAYVKEVVCAPGGDVRAYAVRGRSERPAPTHRMFAKNVENPNRKNLPSAVHPDGGDVRGAGLGEQTTRVDRLYWVLLVTRTRRETWSEARITPSGAAVRMERRDRDRHDLPYALALTVGFSYGRPG
jgi:hypothetical protein